MAQLSGMAQMVCKMAGLDPDQVGGLIDQFQGMDREQINAILANAKTVTDNLPMFMSHLMRRSNQIYEQNRELLALAKGETYAPLHDDNGARIASARDGHGIDGRDGGNAPGGTIGLN